MFNEAIDFDNYEVEYKFDLPKEDDLSEILFTTGTTGKSKGIKIVYRNNVAIAQNVSEAIGITNDDVEMVTAPMNHSMALRRTYTVFYKGGTVVLTDGVKFIEDFFKLLDMYNVTGLTFAKPEASMTLRPGKLTERFGPTARIFSPTIKTSVAPSSFGAKT